MYRLGQAVARCACAGPSGPGSAPAPRGSCGAGGEDASRSGGDVGRAAAGGGALGEAVSGRWSGRPEGAPSGPTARDTPEALAGRHDRAPHPGSLPRSAQAALLSLDTRGDSRPDRAQVRPAAVGLDGGPPPGPVGLSAAEAPAAGPPKKAP